VALSTISLPEHLQFALGSEEIAATEFSARWSSALAEQRALLDEVRSTSKPRDLFALLAGKLDPSWVGRSKSYEELKKQQTKIWNRAAGIQKHVETLYSELRKVKLQIVAAERNKGDHFRSIKTWSAAEEAKRAELGGQIAELLEERRRIITAIAQLKTERLAVERSEEATQLRTAVQQNERDAQMARLKIVRSALLTAGLTHAQHRPTAWWLPMVDRSGHWFQRIVETTEVYTEPLISV
jgi:hypothetical protein